MARYPIIYLRGFAATQGEVEGTVDDPFYGFNAGSTHARVDAEGRSIFFAFESPVVRLMTDHGYADVYDKGSQPVRASARRGVPAESIWIYRYYDVTSKTYDDLDGTDPAHPDEEERSRVRLEIEQAAEGLRRLIDFVKEATGAPKVILVGHSTGGLIARCLLQKVYPDREPGAEMPAFEHVDKVFTYATPHGGIELDVFGGDILEWVQGRVSWNNLDDFRPPRMRQFLTPEGFDGDFDAQSLAGSFPPSRFFCLAGTNARDYAVGIGAVRRLVGPQSDGLVLIRNATLRDAPRAFVHRSHSGRYGIVNSEEGYQNLERFLFGNMRVSVALAGATRLFESVGTERAYQAEVQLSVRGLPALMHDQTLEHHSPIVVERDRGRDDEIRLFDVFLMTELAPEDGVCRYALRLGIHELRRERTFLDLREHLEQVPLWSDHMIVDLQSLGEGEYRGHYLWLSEEDSVGVENRGAPRRPLEWVRRDGLVVVNVPLPQKVLPILGPEARLVMRAAQWE